MTKTQLQEVITLIQSRPAPANDSIAASREAGEAWSNQYPLAVGATVEAADAGGVPGRWISTPDADPDKVYLHLHGGGYVNGSSRTVTALASNISSASGMRALAIDYRLAPEHQFPAAVEDSVTAYRWLLEQGIQPQHIAIGGDSAGGGLTVATMLALRDAGDDLPAAGVCISPWADLAQAGESMQTNASNDPTVGKEGLDLATSRYLGDQDPLHPHASPVYADLTGLPPLLIQMGSVEVLLDDATRLAAQAEDAGVEVQLEIWDDMFHVWHSYAHLLSEAEEAIVHIGEFLREKTG